MAPTTAEATPPHRCTGTRALRVEDARLPMGTGTFADDIVRPGRPHACSVRSPVARARIAAVDVSEALRLDGVHTVFVAQDLNPGVREQGYTPNGRDDPDTPRPPLAAEGEARFVGDPVARVVATDRHIAEDGAEPVVVDYDELPPVVDHATALEKALEMLDPPAFRRAQERARAEAAELAVAEPAPVAGPAAVVSTTPVVAEPLDLIDAAGAGVLRRIAPPATALAALLLLALVLRRRRRTTR